MGLLQDRESNTGESTLQTTPLELVEYDAHWPSMFRREKVRLLAAIGSWAHGIEHIGSTAIPGLCARPSLDILAGVRVLADADTFCTVALQGLGYRQHQLTADRSNDRRLFVKGSQLSHRCVYLYIVEKGSELWRRFIGFRDHLRSHPDATNEYAAHKAALANQLVNQKAYEEAKFAYIRELEQRANLV